MLPGIHQVLLGHSSMTNSISVMLTQILLTLNLLVSVFKSQLSLANNFARSLSDTESVPEDAPSGTGFFNFCKLELVLARKMRPVMMLNF